MVSVANFCPLLGGIVKIRCLYFIYSPYTLAADIVSFLLKLLRGAIMESWTIRTDRSSTEYLRIAFFSSTKTNSECDF